MNGLALLETKCREKKEHRRDPSSFGVYECYIQFITTSMLSYSFSCTYTHTKFDIRVSE